MLRCAIHQITPDAPVHIVGVLYTQVTEWVGATGYLLKNIALDELEQKMIAFMQGEDALLSPAVAKKIIRHFAPKALPVPNLTENLTDKESIVIEMIRDGYSYDEIARRLGISINGTRYYVKSVYKKLEVSNRGELLRKIK